MKKTKWITFLSLILCTAMLFASCGDGENAFADVYDMEKFVYESEIVAYTKADALATYTGWDAEFVADDILAFTKGDSTVIYNVETATQVLQIAETATLAIDYIEGYSYDNVPAVFWVVTEELVEEKYVYKTVLYNAKGEVIATAAYDTAPTFDADLIYFDNVCYRVADNGTIAKAFDYASVTNIPNVDCYNEDYYYDTDSANNRVVIYDKNLKLVNVYEAPNYSDVTFVILSDGNVLVQYVVAQPEDSTDYTFIDTNNEKRLLVSLIYNVEDNETETLELTYAVLDGDALNLRRTPGEENEYNEDIENIVMAYEIENERINTSEMAAKIYSIDEDGQIEATLNVFGKAAGYDLPYAVAPNRYVVKNALDHYTMYDKDGVEIGDVTGADNFYENYIVADGKLYDYDLKKIYDYEREEMTVLRYYESCVLLTKDGETYLFANGAVSTLIAKPAEGEPQTKTVIPMDKYFIIVDATNPLAITYTYYNETGASFATSGQLLDNTVTTGENCLIVSGYNTEGEKVYYCFS